MASFTNNKIKDTYIAILKFIDNGTAAATLKNITDGQGNATALSISTTEVEVDGILTATTIVKDGATSDDVLLGDGSTTSLSAINTGSGTGDKHYTHTQGTASATWNITHNLGKNPSIQVVDSANTKVMGDIEHIDLNNCTITFSAAFGGKAYLN